ncbi:50S ribosomal protein L6 [Candidatus Woesearchaeota archaeon]|nr:50S ribosomal protein L6 [Candidatus Woesearchaeota archaeon]
MKFALDEHIPLPQGVQATAIGDSLHVKGPKGELTRRFASKTIHIAAEQGGVHVSTKGTKREKTMIYAIIAHVKRMLQGVQKPYAYTMKVCSGHFPMNVTLSGKAFSVKNFLGEKVPRTMKVKENVTVKITGDQIIVESVDGDLAGQTAACIEKLTRIANRDLRVFQDGIYITRKPE